MSSRGPLSLLPFVAVLKEADSVSQPAERVRSLWKRHDQDCDPDPIYIPKPAGLRRHTVRLDFLVLVKLNRIIPISLSVVYWRNYFLYISLLRGNMILLMTG